MGVGTGKNMPYYPDDVQVTAIDLSERMLSRARRRAKRLGLSVGLRRMDAQALAFPSDTFDTVVATFVFCSVPDPVIGLRELGRVCKPEGEIRLLEHMRARNEALGRLMDIANPLVVRSEDHGPQYQPPHCGERRKGGARNRESRSPVRARDFQAHRCQASVALEQGSYVDGTGVDE